MTTITMVITVATAVAIAATVDMIARVPRSCGNNTRASEVIRFLLFGPKVRGGEGHRR
jgi:hypothetical protein